MTTVRAREQGSTVSKIATMLGSALTGIEGFDEVQPIGPDLAGRIALAVPHIRSSRRPNT